MLCHKQSYDIWFMGSWFDSSFLKSFIHLRHQTSVITNHFVHCSWPLRLSLSLSFFFGSAEVLFDKFKIFKDFADELL
ncbi:hypothetical protein RchiOBHm_Chr7g0192831 [Rosa chinensis]|uniref:Uncharacterized protein n=1 Tax=Rosa chinensis TaxID=74649 RepID=A0A2P6P5M6_ROSCH|nr:hypothetical protein RchiOBHm_Chr7g0192831 [Rosa chinensis]